MDWLKGGFLFSDVLRRQKTLLGRVGWLHHKLQLDHIRVYLVGGIATPLNNMKVNWDDEIPNIWENKIHVPNHQLDMNVYMYLLFGGPQDSGMSIDCLKTRFPQIHIRSNSCMINCPIEMAILGYPPMVRQTQI